MIRCYAEEVETSSKLSTAMAAVPVLGRSKKVKKGGWSFYAAHVTCARVYFIL